jgi:hypothetical protein
MMESLKLVIELIVVVIGAIIAISVSSCASSPFPPCSQDLQYRCNGAQVEMCTDGNWMPTRHCGRMGFEGEDVEGECRMHGEQAMCEVAR